MKFKTCIFVLFGLAALVSVENLFGQGFVFSNYGVNGGARARVYGVEPGNPHQQLWGNTAEAVVPGTQVYSGAPLLGTNYSVEGYYSLTPVTDMFALNPSARPVQNSLTFFAFPQSPGFFARGDLDIPDAVYDPSPPGYPFMVYLQVRAWDNAGGQFVSWDQAWTAAQARSGHAVGWSTTFEQGLSIGAGLYPSLNNFQSFNLFIVPEPSEVMLALLGSLIYCAAFAPGDAIHDNTHGRVYDRAATNPWSYYFPSLMVNCAGDMVMGFSGSSATNYIGAFYSLRLAGGWTTDVPRVIRAGNIYFGGGARWGDYSATTLDPADDTSFWSVQEVADESGHALGTYDWSTVIVKIRPDL